MAREEARLLPPMRVSPQERASGSCAPLECGEGESRLLRRVRQERFDHPRELARRRAGLGEQNEHCREHYAGIKGGRSDNLPAPVSSEEPRRDLGRPQPGGRPAGRIVTNSASPSRLTASTRSRGSAATTR